MRAAHLSAGWNTSASSYWIYSNSISAAWEDARPAGEPTHSDFLRPGKIELDGLARRVGRAERCITAAGRTRLSEPAAAVLLQLIERVSAALWTICCAHSSCLRACARSAMRARQRISRPAQAISSWLVKPSARPPRQTVAAPKCCLGWHLALASPARKARLAC